MCTPTDALTSMHSVRVVGSPRARATQEALLIRQRGARLLHTQTWTLTTHVTSDAGTGVSLKILYLFSRCECFVYTMTSLRRCIPCARRREMRNHDPVFQS